MSQKGADDIQMQKALDIGRQSLRVMPQIKNWCSNIEIVDEYRGMLSQMYGVPTLNYVKCPHTSSSLGGMDLEGIAESFILENCIGCSFHVEVHENSFGRKVVERHNERRKQMAAEALEREKYFNELKVSIDHLAVVEKTKGETKQLSVLRLIEKLNSEEDLDKTIQEIIEASKVSPDFFSDIAIDYLVLFSISQDKTELFPAILTVAQTGRQFTEFTRRQVHSYLSNAFSDVLTGIYNLTATDLQGDKDLFKTILDSLRYERHIGEPSENKSFPHTQQLFSRLSKENRELFDELVSSKLEEDNKHSRIDINGFLLEFITIESMVVVDFVPRLIKSYNFLEDKYGDSADSKTSETIAETFKVHPDATFEALKNGFIGLSEGGKLSMFDLFQHLLSEVSLNEEQTKYFTETLTKEYFHGLTESIRKDALETIKYTGSKNPKAFADKYSAFLGELIKVCKQQDSHALYKAQLDLPPNQIPTFNPLVGKSYFDIQGIEIEMRRRRQDLEGCLEWIGRYDQTTNVETLLSTINGLRSNVDGTSKAELIKLLSYTASDKMIVSNLLPNIYTWLLDSDSENVREEAVSFIDTLLNRDQDLITSTITELLRVFLEDSAVGVRIRALKAFGTMTRKRPNEIGSIECEKVISALSSEFVGVHKTAANLAHDIYPFLNNAQKINLVNGILNIERHYFKQRKFDYSKDLLPTLLFLTKENSYAHDYIINSILAEYCDVTEPYIDEDALKLLTDVYEENKGISELWLQKALNFLLRDVEDSMGSNPEWSFRTRLYRLMYSLPGDTISRNTSIFEKTCRGLISRRDMRSTFQLLSVLGYYRRHSEVIKLIEGIDTRWLSQKANEHANVLAAELKSFHLNEQSISAIN